jgi:hypothetical protein
MQLLSAICTQHNQPISWPKSYKLWWCHYPFLTHPVPSTVIGTNIIPSTRISVTVTLWLELTKRTVHWSARPLPVPCADLETAYLDWLSTVFVIYCSK